MNAPKQPELPSKGQFLVYATEDGRMKIEVRLEGETVWLTQADIAELFQVKPQNITMHLKNIYAEAELDEGATCKEFLQVQSEGIRAVQRLRKSYNLDAIISVGHRIVTRKIVFTCDGKIVLLEQRVAGFASCGVIEGMIRQQKISTLFIGHSGRLDTQLLESLGQPPRTDTPLWSEMFNILLDLAKID